MQDVRKEFMGHEILKMIR